MEMSSRDTLNALFEHAILLPPDKRTAFIADSCGTDPLLRGELESLLQAYEASEGYFEELAERVIGPAATAVSAAVTDDDAGGATVGGRGGLGIGEVVAHYQVLERIGAGGMGEVFKARDVRLGRMVALKFLPATLAADGQAHARLWAEAKTASALDHPNIGVVFEIAETNAGQPFIAMAWYEGETLGSKLARGPLAVEEAVDIAAQLASALAAAHREAVIHRDVKPANVLITGAGLVKLVDFGIAKVTGAERTREGSTPGTIAYMSPEQTHGTPLDPRTDLWSLGVVLYEMVAGRQPFRAENEQALIHAIRHDQPEPLDRLRADVPADLAAIVAACLEKEPSRRYRRADDLLADLGALDARGGSRTRPARRVGDPTSGRTPRRPRMFQAGTAAALLAFAVASGYFGLRRSADAGTPGGGDGVSPTAVAVFPFDVRGSPDLAYLREGMVSLLATKLYGAGDLRTVDPNALIRRTGEAVSLDPVAGSALATRLGAGLFILGNVVGGGTRLHLDASLYEAGTENPLARAGVEGPPEDLFALVDQLAVELLSTRVRQPETGLGRAADLTTHSLPALRAFLQGEEEWRAFRTGPATQAYRRAVEEDSTFALAHLRLVSLSWSPGRHRLRPSLDAALRHQQRLSQRDRLFLRAQAAFLHSPLDVEGLVRDLTVRYPDDGEAWSMLGELWFHGNPSRGRPATEAREPLERALSLNPGYLEPFVHVVDIAAMEGRYADVLGLLDRWSVAGGEDRLPMRILARFALGTEAERQAVLAELRSAPDPVRLQVLILAINVGPPDLLRESLDLQRARPVRAPPPLAWRLPVWQGRPQEAMTMARHPDEASPNAEPAGQRDRSLVQESRIALLPFVDVPATDLARLRAEILALKTPAAPAPDHNAAADSWQQLVWALGALSVRLNDLPEAERYAAELEAAHGSDAYGVAARVRSRSLRALMAHAQGRAADALRLLESVESEIFSLCDWCTGSAIEVDFALERLLRAELLRELGHDRQALGRYLVDGRPAFPVSHLRAAELYERMGERDNAIRHYTLFTLAWRDAEPAMRSLLDAAELRLERLAGPVPP